MELKKTLWRRPKLDISASMVKELREKTGAGVMDCKTALNESNGDISKAVDIIIETMSESLDQGNRVEIRGFGSFSIRTRKARLTKNPKTGKMMDIPPRKTLHFAMSKSLKEALIGKK